MSSAGPALRVAIVGLGPKGLFALERLVDRVAGSPIEVVAYEPHPVPGAGPVYDPAQPPYLRMNNAAEHVDLWWPGNATVPRAERRSFLQWDEGREGGRGAFVPRASVGRYLADGLTTVLRHAAPGTSVRIEPARVADVRRDGERLVVVTDDGRRATFDEVLLATGHVWPEHPAATTVFPAQRRLGTDVVPPGAVVGIRGFALTAIDAALALTEGRGGRFVPGDAPHRVRYVAAPDAVAGIVPFSRTGLPILAKPASGLHDHVPMLADDGARGRERVLAIDGRSTDAVLALQAAVADVAGDALEAVGAPREAPSPSEWLAGAGPPRRPAADVDRAGPIALEDLSRSLDVAVGAASPGTAWALGHAWRTLYAAVVARFSGSALDDAGWAAFRVLAARLERVAFGPSAANVAKLLALADAGVLDLAHVDGAVDEHAGEDVVVRSPAGSRSVDVFVDAVLAAPGVPAGGEGPIAALVARGELRLLPGRRGLDVEPDGTGRDATGLPVPGLAAIGRPTEDAVIGHDTLSRTLHDQADRWASRVAARAAAESAGHPTDTGRTRVEEHA